MKRMRNIAAVCLAVLGACGIARADLKAGDRVAIIGDSITEQKLYSVYMETYFIACKPAENVSAINVGWSGETATGFLKRMDNELWPFSPTVATTTYGMNDGAYNVLTDDRATAYRQAMTTIAKALKAHDVRFVAIGSPNPVDTKTYKKTPDASVYNQTLASLGGIAKEVAASEGLTYAPMNEMLNEVMIHSKSKLGEDYVFLGNDGVHPAANGHLAMAFVMLKTLGVSGEIGTITVNADGTATGSEGHRILSATPAGIEIESTKYPFCLTGEEGSKQTNSTRSVASFFPFNQDLNRFMVVVKNPTAPKYKIWWGKIAREFTKEQVEAGVNLNDAFLENPFAEQFAKVQRAVAFKQAFETYLLKTLMPMRVAGDLSADEKEGINAVIKDTYVVRQHAITNAQKLVIPIRHTIRVEPIN